MKRDQKQKVQEKQTDKAKSDLAAKNVNPAQADQVRGGVSRRMVDDESPKESRSGRA